MVFSDVQFLNFDKLSDNSFAENMRLHGSILQGSRYS